MTKLNISQALKSKENGGSETDSEDNPFVSSKTGNLFFLLILTLDVANDWMSY